MSEQLDVHQYENRDEYKNIQIERSQRKFEYCKVFYQDVFRYKQSIGWDYFREENATRKTQNWRPASILCLGVRSGAENDIFRTVFYAPLMQSRLLRERLIKNDNQNTAVSKINLARKYGLGAGQLDDGKVIGVEINPDAARSDIHVGSFDELPAEWDNRFDILFTNSFDHAMDPAHTVAEWKRVAKPGAYAITCFSLGQKQSYHDPVAGLSFSTLADLWDAPIVFATQTQNKNGYHEICFRLD